MKRMLINATQKEEIRVALVDGQKLYNLDIESFEHKQKKSNIYKGKITRIEPSLEAVFVDYGTERHGFLPFKEISSENFSFDFSTEKRKNIKNFLQENQEVIVQVYQEERGNKGAALTTFISLAGSYLVLMPNNPRTVGISRKIEGIARVEMKEMVSSLSLPKGMGIIVRTSGLGKPVDLLQWDLTVLLNRWNSIKKSASIQSAPFLIHQERNIIARAFRDYLRPDIGEIIIDDPSFLDLAKEYIFLFGRPDFIDKIRLYKGNIPLFSYYQIESRIESAFQREVRLPSGGSIFIDTTEALTAIDINSARATKGLDIEETAFKTNLEAADEIALQLRLRDLGGLIVIDFIDMNLLKHQREIENRLKGAVFQDRARIQIGKISRFGLLELSRQRLSPSLRESSHHICPRCNGTGTIRDNKSLSLAVLRLIEEEALKENTYEIHAIVPVPIASYLLNEKRESINIIEKRQNRNIRTIIVPNDQMQTPQYTVLRIRKEEKTEILSYLLPNFYKSDHSNFDEDRSGINKFSRFAIEKSIKSYPLLIDDKTNIIKIVRHFIYFISYKLKLFFTFRCVSRFFSYLKKEALLNFSKKLEILFDKTKRISSFFGKKIFRFLIFCLNVKGTDFRNENHEKKIEWKKRNSSSLKEREFFPFQEKGTKKSDEDKKIQGTYKKFQKSCFKRSDKKDRHFLDTERREQNFLRVEEERIDNFLSRKSDQEKTATSKKKLSHNHFRRFHHSPRYLRINFRKKKYRDINKNFCSSVSLNNVVNSSEISSGKDWINHTIPSSGRKKIEK